MYNDFDTFPHCLTPSTPAHLFTCAIIAIIAIISPYHDTLTSSGWTLIRCHYLDVETYTLMSRQYIPWCQATLKTRLSCLFIRAGCDPFTAAFIWHSSGIHGSIHPTIQHPIDKHLPDSVNIRCSTRCLRQQAVEQYMAMVWADGQVGFNEVRIERLNAGWFGGMALDVVVWGVVSLNKVSIGGYLGHLGWIRGKVRDLN